jgi:hypothetical protein
MTPPVELGRNASPRYRVAPTVRFLKALKTLKRMPVIRAVAPRRAASNPGHATIDLHAKLDIRELKYPGEAGNAKLVDDKWVYLFNIEDGTCELEGKGTVKEHKGRKQQIWQYAIEQITPRSHKSSRTLSLESFQSIELQKIGKLPSKTWGVFLTPKRLSSTGLEYLLDELKTSRGRSDAGSALTKVSWRTTDRGWVWAPDPWLWAEDAFWENEHENLEKLLAWHADEDKQAKLFIAGTLIGLHKSGVTQFKNNLRSGAAESFVKKSKAEQKKLLKNAEIAAAYVGQCVDAPEHRAVELSAHDGNAQDISDALQHWAIVLMGKNLTASGRFMLRLVAEKRLDSTPMKYVFATNLPSNMPSLGEARYGYIAVRQIMGDLLPTVFDIKRSKIGSLAADDWQKAMDGLGNQVEKLYNKVKARGTGSTPARRVRKKITRAIKAGKQNKKVSKWFSRLLVSSDIKLPATPDSVLKSTDQKWSGWTSRITKLKKVLIPVQGLAEIWNLCSGISAWQSATANDPKLQFYGGFEMGTKTINAIGASTDFGGWVVEVSAVFKKVGEKTASRIAGPLAIVSGTSEMLCHGQASLDAAYGRNNIAAATASGIAAFGGALGAIGGAMALASSFASVSAAFGHIGIIIAVIGGILVFLGALMAALLTRDAYEQFAEHCFLGDSAGEDSGYDHKWSPIRPLPSKDVKQQVVVLMHILGAFQIKLDAWKDPKTGSHAVFNWGKNKKFDANIVLGYVPPNSTLFIEVEMVFGWFTGLPAVPKPGYEFKSLFTVTDSTKNLDWNSSKSSLVLPTPVVERTADGKLKKVPIELRPSAVMVKGVPKVIDETSMRSLQQIIVRAYLTDGHTGSKGFNVPPSGTWCTVKLHGQGAVEAGHTLDKTFIK